MLIYRDRGNYHWSVNAVHKNLGDDITKIHNFGISAEL